MTQPDRQEPGSLAPAIRLLALAIVFLAGSIMFGLGAASSRDLGILSLGLGALVMLVSGIIFIW